MAILQVYCQHHPPPPRRLPPLIPNCLLWPWPQYQLCPWAMHTYSLANPFTIFHPVLPTPSPLSPFDTRKFLHRKFSPERTSYAENGGRLLCLDSRTSVQITLPSPLHTTSTLSSLSASSHSKGRAVKLVNGPQENLSVQK